jgi:hypothetical protein
VVPASIKEKRTEIKHLHVKGVTFVM